MSYISEGIIAYTDCLAHAILYLPRSIALIVLMGICDTAAIYLSHWMINRYPNRAVIINRLQSASRMFFSWFSYRYLITIMDPFDSNIVKPVTCIITNLLLPDYEVYSSSIVQFIVGLGLIHSKITHISITELFLNTCRTPILYIYKTHIAPGSDLGLFLDTLMIFGIEFLLGKPIALVRLFVTTSATLLLWYFKPVSEEEVLRAMERLMGVLEDKIKQL